MSAFVVSKHHLDYLVTAGLYGTNGGRRDLLRWYHGPASAPAHTLSRETASRVGQLLADENQRSVSYRYDEPGVAPVYTFAAYRGAVTPVQTLKAIHCYEYQACEHPEWEQSEAFAFCRALEARIVRRLPGYEEAVWGVPAEFETTGGAR